MKLLLWTFHCATLDVGLVILDPLWLLALTYIVSRDSILTLIAAAQKLRRVKCLHLHCLLWDRHLSWFTLPNNFSKPFSYNSSNSVLNRVLLYSPVKKSLSQLLIKLHAMKPCGALEVYLYAFYLQNSAFSDFFDWSFLTCHIISSKGSLLSPPFS